MSPDQISQLEASSALAWVSLNQFHSENQRVIEFKDHRFLIDLYADESADIAVKKSAQCGGSVCFIFKAGHTCKYRLGDGRNVIYVLPTQNIVKDFVQPKVDPLISTNPKFAKLVTKDSVSLKQIGGRFLYFKGASSEREAIAISGDTLILDELDRMTDMTVVNTYDSRLQASDDPRRWRLSNPSSAGFGIDAAYNAGTQYHWFIKCHHCNHEWFIDDERADDKRHYLDAERIAFVCGKCQGELSNDDRKNGRWVARFRDRARHSYWLSQLMVPYVTAARVLEQKSDSSIEFYNNFVLGKAYTPSDMLVNRETILRATVPSRIPRVQVAIGVDQKATDLQWVAMTPQGVFAYGHAKSWEEIEMMKLTWSATVVADGRPYMTGPKQLSEKYPDFYVALGKPMDTALDTLQWKDQTVYYSRVKLLDIVANEITECKLLFRLPPSQMEEMITEWGNVYRTTVEEPDGRVKSDWVKKEENRADFPFATAYARIALSRILGSGSSGILMEPAGLMGSNVTDQILPNGKLESTLGPMLEQTMKRFG